VKTKGAARERTGAVGRRRGTRSLHTQSLRGSMQEGKERAREGRHLLAPILATLDTSQRPMSWSNASAAANTVARSHTRATSNTKHTTPTEERGPVRVQKRSSNGFARGSEQGKRRPRRGTIGMGIGSEQGIDARGKSTCERKEALTSCHVGHACSVPQSNGAIKPRCLVFIFKPQWNSFINASVCKHSWF
jgi:hypothetical protein